MTARFHRDWRRALVESFSDLFHPEGDPPGAAGWPFVEDGWRDLLQRACVRIRAAVRADGGSFAFTQIKEKYGTVRAYWAGSLSADANARVEEAIDLAEARSACTCEVCGEPGRLYGPGWFTTRCAAHAEDRRAVESRPGFDNILIVQRIVGGRRRTTARRYDRATDSFIDVDPGSLNIGEE